MPRKAPPKKRVRNFTEKELAYQIDVYLSKLGTRDEISKRKACKIPGTDREIPGRTFRRWLSKNRPQQFGAGRPTSLTIDEERSLVNMIITLQSYGWPMTEEKLEDFVKNYVESMGTKTPFKNNQPGHDWFLAFRKRWKTELSMRKPEILTVARAKSTTYEVHRNFMNFIGKSYVDLEITQPEQVWNCDETGMNTNPTRGQLVLARRGAKDVFHLAPNEGKAQFTVMFCGNAAGNMLPPFIIFKGKEIRTSMVESGPPGAGYCTSESGWMDKRSFREFVKFLIDCLKDEPKPAFVHLDGHASHFDVEALQMALDAQIILSCLPPNATHIYQPLDVGYFKDLKAVLVKVLNEFYDDRRRTKSLTKQDFPQVLKTVLQRCNSMKLKSAFGRCGLFPWNPAAIPAHKFAPSELFERESIENSSVNDSSVDSIAETEAVSPSTSSRIPVIRFGKKPTPNTAMRLVIVKTLTPRPQETSSGRGQKVPRKSGEWINKQETINRMKQKEIDDATKKRKPPKFGTKRAVTASVASITQPKAKRPVQQLSSSSSSSESSSSGSESSSSTSEDQDDGDLCFICDKKQPPGQGAIIRWKMCEFPGCNRWFHQNCIKSVGGDLQKNFCLLPRHM